MSSKPDKARTDRCGFIGGSDARIIMSPDEAALIRLWKEKRGEAEPEDLSGNLVVQLGVATEALNLTWYERNTGRAVTDVSALGSAPCASLSGGDARWVRQRPRRGVRGQVHAALVVLGRSGGRKAHGATAAQHVGDQRPVGGPLDHHRRGKMDRDDHPGRCALPALSGHRRAPVLALRSDRRHAAPLWDRAAAAADRSGSRRRHERVQFLGGVRWPLLRHPLGLSRP